MSLPPAQTEGRRGARHDTNEGLGGTQALRYGGHILGVKLLANVYTLPFGSFAGPDWEWLSASFALGANFSLFDVGQLWFVPTDVKADEQGIKTVIPHVIVGLRMYIF
jgi:hypothetical protein